MQSAAILLMSVFAAIGYGIVHDRAHNASYAVGGIGGVVAMVRVWRSRREGRPCPAAIP